MRETKGGPVLEEQMAAKTVMPVIGNDGLLLGVTMNGVTCVRPKDVSYDEFAVFVLNRIVVFPRDTTSVTAKKMIESDNQRIAALKRQNVEQ